MEERHQDRDYASAHNFPKFVNGSAAMEHELRKVGTRHEFVSGPLPNPSGRAHISAKPEKMATTAAG